MELININKIKYNIGIDAGDNITNVLFNKDDYYPCNKNITFSIPEIDEEYNIKIIIGNNILTEDNIVLDNITIKSEDNNRKIFINIKIDYYLYVDITTKLNTIYKNIINININREIIYFNKDINIDNYKYKFNLLQIIKIINKKIRLNCILLDDESKIILQEKFNNIYNKLDSYNNQKLLEIINTLKNNFFIN